jgi:hypothetical protein
MIDKSCREKCAERVNIILSIIKLPLQTLIESCFGSIPSTYLPKILFKVVAASFSNIPLSEKYNATHPTKTHNAKID